LPLLRLFNTDKIKSDDLNVDDFTALLLKTYDLPSVAYGVIKDGEIVLSGAKGVIKRDSEIKVSASSKYHIGSNTKAMTALLAGIAVDRSEISWQSTIQDMLGQSMDNIPGEYQKVTLAQLLSHTGGIPEITDQTVWASYFTTSKSPQEQRRQMVKDILQTPRAYEPGTRFRYSNAGYTIAGLMLEEATGRSWEDLMTERIFHALNMDRSGFGAPAMGAEQSEPWGHNPEAVPPASMFADNPAGMGPAGTVYATLPDLFNYAFLWLGQGQLPQGKILLSKHSYNEIIKVRQENYGLGWGSMDGGSEIKRLLAHDGSNTTFYSRFYFMPETNHAVIILINDGSKNARPFIEELTTYLMKNYLGLKR